MRFTKGNTSFTHTHARDRLCSYNNAIHIMPHVYIRQAKKRQLAVKCWQSDEGLRYSSDIYRYIYVCINRRLRSVKRFRVRWEFDESKSWLECNNYINNLISYIKNFLLKNLCTICHPTVMWSRLVGWIDRIIWIRKKNFYFLWSFLTICFKKFALLLLFFCVNPKMREKKDLPNVKET